MFAKYAGKKIDSKKLGILFSIRLLRLSLVAIAIQVFHVIALLVEKL